MGWSTYADEAMMQTILKYIKEQEKADKMANIQSTWGQGLQTQIQPQQANINAAQAQMTGNWAYAATTLSGQPYFVGDVVTERVTRDIPLPTAKELLHDINALLSSIKALRGGA